jgi:hypothetical protein
MADASRFPRLALPFGIIGASAGWLSAGLLANPLFVRLDRSMQTPTAIVAMVLAIGAGVLIRQLCIGRHYWYDLETPDPRVRPWTDRWWLHAAIVVCCGTICGAFIGAKTNEAEIGALDGSLCALIFVPICLLVIRTARRAQRARLGSIVAASDRRAIWIILASALAVGTFESVPDWAAARIGRAPIPLLALAMSIVAGAVVIRGSMLDARAKSSAAVVMRELEPAPVDAVAPKHVDLGLGDDVHARIATSSSPYRGCDRMQMLVRGNPSDVLRALERAMTRDIVGLLFVLSSIALQGVASSSVGGAIFFRNVDPPRQLPEYGPGLVMFTR